MSESESSDVKATLAKPDVHQKWESAFRTAENEAFYELAFDYIARVLSAPRDATILDVGCGIGAHSVRLARRGFRVTGVDFSATILKEGEENLRAKGVADRVTLQREDILNLSFAADSFDNVLCWGVLMHIPDVERAIAELCRVLKPGGALVISEGNMRSLQSFALTHLRPLTSREPPTIRRTAAGMEDWSDTAAGKLMTRAADIGWIIRTLDKHGLTVEHHVAGQFTELYSRFSSALMRRLIHGFNGLWFRYIKLPGPTYGNLLFARKRMSR